MTEAALRKRLDTGDYAVLITLAESLSAKAADIRLILTEDQSKQLQKVKKWSNIVKECHSLSTMS